MKALRVIDPGPFTTIQDRGRFGLRHFGIPPCGMLDPWSGTLANILVGNEPDAAVLEWTFLGGRLEALGEFDMAITGGHMPLSINGVHRELWISHRVHRGDCIELGAAQSGCRTYLALTGGIDVPLVMGSRSTHITAKMGGYNGRILAKEDLLFRGVGSFLDQPRVIPKEWIPRYDSEILLRVILGPQESYFGKGRHTFFSKPFTVSPQSNRMGYRLQDFSVRHKRNKPQSIISEPILPGTVQVPEDGNPIILLVEQTVGGYSKIAVVISADIPRLAQAVPGNTIRFEKVTLQEAHRIHREKAKQCEDLISKFPKNTIWEEELLMY